MNVSMESDRRPYKPPYLMLAILGVHVAAAGFFMMMSGCSTKKPVVEPPPAPVMPPSVTPAVTQPAIAPVPRATFKPPVPVERAPETADAVAGSSYTIQKGDSLSKIAARAGVSVREITELNKITDPNKVRVGQKLLLPAYAKSLPSAPVEAAPKPAKKPAAKASEPAGPAVASGNTHTVASGDTLGKLASRYGTTVAAFKSVNNLKSDTIRVGQKLTVPEGKAKTSSSSATATPAPAAPAPAEPAPAVAAPAPEAAPASAPAPVEAAPAVVDPALPTDTAAAPAVTDDTGETPFPYTVKSGDTLDSIAIKFSVRKDVIMRLNNLTSETVKSGDKLLIPWQ